MFKKFQISFILTHCFLLSFFVVKNSCCITHVSPKYQQEPNWGLTRENRNEEQNQILRNSYPQIPQPNYYDHSLTSQTNEHKQTVQNLYTPSKDLTFAYNGDTPNTLHIEMSSNLKYLNANETGIGSQAPIYFMIRNEGNEDEFVTLYLTDQYGQEKILNPTPFHLPKGSSKEIPVDISKIYTEERTSLNPRFDKAPFIPSDNFTIKARDKRNSVAAERSFSLNPQYESFGGYGSPISPHLGQLGHGVGGGGPHGLFDNAFCYDRDVKGTCRYRTDPHECLSYEWTAYATIQSRGAIQSIRSIPEGLYIPDFVPGQRNRVRVYMRISCCTPFVQFLVTDPFNPHPQPCIVSVEELQDLHPGEIAGIAIGGLLLLIIFIILIAFCVRRSKQRTMLVGHTRNHELTRE